MMSLEDLMKDECCVFSMNYHADRDLPGHFEALIEIVVDGKLESVTARGTVPESAINSVVVATNSLLKIKREHERNGVNES